MSVSGIGAAGYPLAGYVPTRTQRKEAAGNYAGQMESARNVQSGIITLHISNEQDGESIGAMADYENSVTVYRTRDFDPENPVYKVKIWDARGNVTERMVDISEVNPQNCDTIDMFAYSSHLSASGECPGAQSAFMGSRTDNNGLPGNDLFGKRNWVEAVRDMMQMQYEAGNLKGYLDYKQFRDFLNR